MTPEETLRQALLEDKFPESDEKPIVPIADPLKYNRMTAVSAWMGNLIGQDISPEDIGWQAEKDALAQEFFKMPDAKDVSDETVHDLIRSHIQTSDNAKRIAFSSASSGRSITQALNEVDSVAGVSKTRGIRDRYLNEASTIYGNVATNLAPYRTIIDQAAKTIEGFDTKAEGASDAFTQIAESLLPLPPKERLMVISAIGEVGAATPKDQQAYLLKLVLAMDREAEKAVTGTASLAESLFFAGGAVEMSTMNVPGIAKATAEYAQKRRELQVLSGQVKMMAQSKINPIEGNNWWEETGIGVARMAPLLVATMANSPAAIAVMTGQFRDEATVEAVNAGESLDNAEAIASIAAPIMAGQEFLSNALPLGKIKIPFIDKWLKASTTSIKSAALRVATRGTIGTGAEITEEIMQTVTPLLTQDLLSDWQSEWSIESGISKSDWDERMPKISDIAKGTFGPAFVISFLMAGRISISDVKNSRALMTSPNYMVASGISPDLANQIAAEGLKGNYNEVDALFRKGFDKGNQASPEQIKEAESKIDVKASNTLEYYNKLRKEFGVGTVSNIGNGKYQFTTPILKDAKGEITDSGISAEFNSISEANEAQMLHIKNRQASIRKAEQEFITSMNTSLEEKQGLDIALMDFDMFTKTFTELFPSTTSQVEQRIKLTDQIDGAVEDISLENSVLESEANDNKNYRILGTNSIEQREGISTGVITLYNGGSLLDLIEESAEVGVKRLMSDPSSRTKLILQIRDVEAKMKDQAMQMGQKHMPLIATGDDNQVSNMEIIEAFSHIAKSYYVQTAKAVERPTFTSDMPLNLYLGSLQSSIAGMELKDAIDLVGEKTLNILYRASQIKAVYDANGLNQDFVDALEKSVGLNVSNRNADGVVDTAAGLAADAGVSMSMGRVSPAQDARQKAFDAFREARRDAENILDEDRAKIREGVQIFQEDGDTFWNAFYRGRYNGMDYDPDGSFTIWFDETKGKWMSQGDNGFDSMPTEDNSFAAASDWVKQQFVEDWENQQVDRSFGQFERGKDEAFNILDSFVPPLGIESRQRKPWEGSGGIGPSGSIYGEFAPTGSDDVVWKLRIADHENTSRQHRQPDEQFIVSKSWTPESVEEAMQRAYNWLAKQKTTVTFSISPAQDAEYLELAKNPEKNRTLLQKMVDAAAKTAGYMVEAWHGSPDFKGNIFDRKFFGRNTGLSRGGFSFTTDREAAVYYMSGEVEESQAMVDSANKVMAELQTRIDQGLEWKGPFDEYAPPEFRSDLVDDIDEIAGYLRSIAKTLPSDLKQKLLEAVKLTQTEATPRLIHVYLKNPTVVDVSGKELLQVTDSSQIKSADPVTYDNAGNIIPLSQRFNEATPDINFSMGSAQPYKDRSGEDASSPLTDTEIREGIEDEQGTQAESPIDIADLSEVLDDPSLPDIPWGDSMTSFSMAPGLSPWKQITREDLKKAGKKAFAFYADRMRVGTYSGIDPSSGINIPLQGGFDFPAQNEMIENDIAWAVSDKKTVKSMITSAIRTGGHAIIALFSRGNVTGNATFLQAYFEELRWNIKQGKITEQQALDFFHEAKQSAGVKNNAIPSAKGTTDKATGEKIPPTPERVKEVEEKREAFAKLKWTSLDEVERVLGSLSFKLRGSGFFKTTLNENAKRGVHIAAGIMGKQELVNAGMPDVAKMVELMEEPNFTNLPLGTIVGIVQIDPDQKVQTAVQMGVTPHKSYPYVVRGKRVGVFKKEHHIEDFIPLKPKSSRIMEGEAMAATISFSMEKANRKNSLRVPTFSISRSDFTGRIEQSLRPIFEGSPEAKLKIGMMALKRAQAVAAESLYDVGRAGAAKRKLAEMEASRIKKLGKVTDKTPDWVKKSLEKETTPEQAKAALMKDKLNGWIQMHDAIVSSMPTEIRGTIGSISTLAKLSSDEARLRFIEDRIPKVEKAIEKYLKKGYGERIDKMLEAAAVKGKAGEIPKSKFIVTVQDELNTIIEMTNLSTDDTVKEAARYEAEIISAQTAEDAADAFAKAQLLEVFGDLYGKQTTAEEMDVAHEYLKDLMKQGRAARKVLDEARAAEVAAMVKQAKSDAFAGAANAATVQAGKDKGKGTTKGMLKGLLRELGSHRFVLSSVFGRSNKTADHFDEQMILGVNAFETKQAERKKSLRDFMRTLYGTKSKIRLDIELEKMETRVERSGVTKMEGEKRESDTKTVEEVERIIKSPSTFGYSAEEAQIWEYEMDAWSNLPTSRKRNLTIERIKVKGTRIEIPLSQMEAVYMAMALRQPGILDQQTVHGYDLITQAELDDFMSDKSKNWLAWFGAEYANEYDAANEVFMKLFNTRMPQIQFYAPLLKNHQGNQAALDPLNANVVSQSANPGAVKSRRGRTSSLRIESALAVYQSHFAQMDYWINMAEYLRDTQAVMLNPEVRAAIQSEHGDEAMQAVSAWVQLEMARGVSKGSLLMHSSRMMRNVKSGIALKALAFNIGTSIKTLSSVFYSLGEIPITRWPVAFARGIQHWGRMWDTNIIQNRLELGGTPEIRHILANRGKAPNMVLRLIENALVYGSTPTQYADAVLTSYSAAMVYGDRLAQAEKAGAGDEAAHKYAAREMEIAVSRTAQPNDWSGRSLIENDVTGVFNLLSMFSSDPRQKLSLVGEAIMKWKRGGSTNEEAMRKFLAYWIIPGLMFQVANAVTRSMFKDDDKEWEVDNFLRAALVGPLQGFFILGAAAEFFIASAVAYAAEKITGEEQDKPRNWRSSTNPLVDISDQFLKSIQKLPEKIEEEDFLGGAWEIMKAGGALSTPFSPAGAAPGVADRVFKDTTTLFYGKEED